MESLEKSGYGSNSKNQGSRSFSSGLGLKRKYKCNCRGFHCWPAEGTLSEQIGFGAEAQPGTNNCICWCRAFTADP